MICCAHVITTSVSLVLIVAQPSYCPLVGKSAKPPLTLHLYPTLWLHRINSHLTIFPTMLPVSQHRPKVLYGS